MASEESRRKCRGGELPVRIGPRGNNSRGVSRQGPGWPTLSLRARRLLPDPAHLAAVDCYDVERMSAAHWRHKTARRLISHTLRLHDLRERDLRAPRAAYRFGISAQAVWLCPGDRHQPTT